ncbi:hypothetical protein MTYP_00466 [Methylophilaceae bacterium]|nr:hypothetical protein MTYP_00466 [Methylophilaceae bacterium]
MNKTKYLLLAGLLGTALTASAEDAQVAEPASAHSFSSNIGLFSDYVFRGISYGRERGAVQGGFDYAHDSGIYLGLWATSVHQDTLYGNTVELDIYGGYFHQFTDDLSLDVGFLQFYYPNNKKLVGQSANTTEVSAALTYKYLTLKHSYALTDFFGINTKSAGDGDSKGSGYTELNFNYPLPFQGLNLALHAGHQTVKHYSVANYTDFLIGVSKDFSIANSDGWNAGINYTTTDADDDWYVTADGYETGDDKVIVYLKRTF